MSSGFEAAISAALEGREKFARLRTKLSRAHEKRELAAVFSVAYRVAKTLDIYITYLSDLEACRAVQDYLNRIGLEIVLEEHLQEYEHTGNVYVPSYRPASIYRCFVRRKEAQDVRQEGQYAQQPETKMENKND